ncbi:unnamed protein product [Alopecurus aequalis]
MSRYLRQYEKGHMKMAMLKQEETFKQQVQELHRLYRVQQLLMTGMPNTVPSVRYKPDDEQLAQEKDAGSSRSWGPEQRKAPPPTVIEEGDLDLTLAIGSLVTAETKRTRKDTSSSVDSRASISSSSSNSGSPDCRVLPPHPSQLGSSGVKASTANDGQPIEQEGIKHPPWLHQCLNLAR